MLTSLKFLSESPNYIMVIAAGIIPAYPASIHPSINSGQTKTVIYSVVMQTDGKIVMKARSQMIALLELLFLAVI